MEETEIKIYEDPVNLYFYENIEIKYTDGELIQWQIIRKL